MKILTLHVDYIKFKPLKKALKKIGDLSESEKKGGEAKDSLVVMIAVEKRDGDVKTVVGELVKNIKEIAEQVKVKNIVLYPYAHLSNNLSSPEIGIKVLEESEKKLKKDFNVLRAPFGYYKEFELKVKGHPLSELSREIPSGLSHSSAEASSNEREIISGKESEDGYDAKQLLREITKTKLDRSKLKDNDHRILGEQMDLFSFSETAPGMVFWHNNGLIIRNELINFWREVHRKAGYQEISTPQILDKKLWQISGHWEKYKENIFLTEYDKREFAIKPMNCPGGMLVYKNKPKSYKDFPLRVAELGIVHRQELSGTLGGLFRLVKFTQDDAHIFCTENQVEEELIKVIDLIDFVYKKFNLPYRVELSTRPEKRIGSDEIWDIAEEVLEKVLKKKKIKFKINKGDGAFYGPKIDFHVTDSLKREWQCGTLQLDFAMPERFELEYTDKDNKKKRPVMLHRTVYGSLGRFIGMIIEHYNGRFPTWLAPMQVRVLSFTDRNEKYAREVIRKFGEEISGLRIDADFRKIPIPNKVKDAELMKVPYIVTVGDREEKDRSLAIRIRGSKKLVNKKVGGFIKDLKKEIEERL